MDAMRESVEDREEVIQQLLSRVDELEQYSRRECLVLNRPFSRSGHHHMKSRPSPHEFKPKWRTACQHEFKQIGNGQQKG